MPNEIQTVHQGTMVLRCGASLKFGIALAFPLGQGETTLIPVTSPSNIPLVGDPLLVLDLLSNWFLPSHD